MAWRRFRKLEREEGVLRLKISRSESRKGRPSGGSVSASQTQRFGSNTSFSPSLTAQTPSDSPYPVFGRHEGHGVNHLTRGIPGPCRRQPIRKWLCKSGRLSNTPLHQGSVLTRGRFPKGRRWKNGRLILFACIRGSFHVKKTSNGNIGKWQ